MERQRRSGRRLLPGRSGASVDELPLWAVAQGASSFIVDLSAYEAFRVAGIVRSLRLDPTVGVVEVTLADGTGTVSASWTIRRPTPQLALVPGRAAVLRGVATVGPAGDIVLTEPQFMIVPLDEAMAA